MVCKKCGLPPKSVLRLRSRIISIVSGLFGLGCGILIMVLR